MRAKETTEQAVRPPQLSPAVEVEVLRAAYAETEYLRAEAVDILRALYAGERGARVRAKVLLAHHAGFGAGTEPEAVGFRVR